LFTLNFWKQALERAVKTGVQSAATVLAIGEGFNVFAVDWNLAGAFFLSGAVMSVVTSFLTAGFGESDSPSAVAIASAPPEPEKGAVSVGTVLAIAALVCGILAIVGAGSLPWLAIGLICVAVAMLI
jgi:hypothetical protein